MSKIISKIGFSEFKSCLESDSVKDMIKKQDVEGAGIAVIMDVAGIILSNLSDCENELYKFLADLTGAKVDELKNAPMADFAELIITLVQKEEFKDFIGVVSRSFK